jgi:hypothetical protein
MEGTQSTDRRKIDETKTQDEPGRFFQADLSVTFQPPPA